MSTVELFDGRSSSTVYNSFVHSGQPHYLYKLQVAPEIYVLLVFQLDVGFRITRDETLLVGCHVVA